MMNGIQVLLNEHEYINQFADVVENMCCDLLEGKTVDVVDIRKMADFGHFYVDILHHHKEEDILFKAMAEYLGDVGRNLIKYGMLVEHDLGRAGLVNIKNATSAYEAAPTTKNKLAVITYLMSYASMLRLHIVKENTAVYPFGERSLSEDILKSVDSNTAFYEEKFATERENSLKILTELEKKYSH